MTVELTPEHQTVLKEAAEKAHREFLFGGIGATAKNLEDVEKALKDIQDHRQQLEEDMELPELNLKVKSIKAKARELKQQAKITKLEASGDHKALETELKDLKAHRKELEDKIGLAEINRKVKSIKVKARFLKKQAKSMSPLGIHPPRYSPTPDWMNLTPEEIKKAEEKIKRESRMQTHPYHREVKENWKRKHGSEKSGLVCPCCGEGDHGNRMGGKPVCYMNSKHKAKGVEGPVQLMTPEEAEDWEPPVKAKPPRLTFDEPEDVMRWRKPPG